MSRSRPSESGQAGSAPVEFLAFGLPTIVTCLIVTQVVLSGYLGNVAIDAAAEGAAQASAADGSLEIGIARASEVVRATVPWVAYKVDASESEYQGQTASSIQVELTPSILGLGMFPISAEAWNLNESI